MRPKLSICTVLTQNIGWVFLSLLADKIHDVRHNCFTHSMVGERIVSLSEAGIWKCGAGNDRFIVTKQHCLPFDRYTKVSKRSAQIHDLLGCNMHCNKFCPIGCGFDGILSFGVPINRSTINEVKNACYGPLHDQIMVQILHQ